MPRLTNPDYLKRHYFVAALWEDPAMQPMFTHLSPNERRDVHWYYQTENFHADDFVLRMRATVVEGDPSLPQRSGRAYSVLLTYYTAVAKKLGITDLHDLEESVSRVGKAWLIFREKYNELSKGAKPKRPAGPSRHHVAALVKPTIDGEKFAEALLMLVMHLDEERKRNAGDESGDIR